MVLKLLDEIQQYRLESNVISLNAVRHARRDGVRDDAQAAG